MSDIQLSQLLEAGVHFGHKAYRWNPKMFPYIYSEVNNIHILDLVQSATLLKEANIIVILVKHKEFLASESRLKLSGFFPLFCRFFKPDEECRGFFEHRRPGFFVERRAADPILPLGLWGQNIFAS